MSHRVIKTLIIVSAAAAGYCFARRRSLRWGTLPHERELTLPGDDIIPRPGLQATRAITIRATPEEVWPWIAQLGQGRGGFYSYDALENLLGMNIHSADEVIEAFQGVRVGDEVWLAEPVALRVAIADVGHALVLEGAPDNESGAMGSSPQAPPMPYAFTWSFVLLPEPDGGCRLVVRERYGYLTPWAAPMVEAVEWASFIMSQRMLRGIRDRAEARGGDLAG